MGGKTRKLYNAGGSSGHEILPPFMTSCRIRVAEELFRNHHLIVLAVHGVGSGAEAEWASVVHGVLSDLELARHLSRAQNQWPG